MALKLAPLAVAVILALGCAAAGGEERVPVPTAAPAAPTTAPEGPDPGPQGRGQWGFGPCSPPICVSSFNLAMMLLATLMLGFFVLGLVRRRHDWKPLVLGLFALGLGTLAAVWGLHDRFAKFADMWSACNPGDVYESVARALTDLVWGLIAALAGGLFTVILRWRNAQGDEPDAEEAAEPEPETEG